MTMDAAGVQGFVRAAALDLPDARRIVVHPPLTRETAIQMGMDGAPWPSVTTVAQTYFKALERKIMGQPVYVEGYGPSRGITAFPVYPTETVPTVRQNTGRRDCVSASDCFSIVETLPSGGMFWRVDYRVREPR